MPRDPIDDFLDGLKQAVTEFATDFAQDRIHGAQQPQPRARRVSAKPPKVKKPKTERPAKQEPQGPTLYDLLEVSPKASSETIEAAWKSLARRNHPDTNKSKQAEERMKKLNHAKDILLDATKRSMYDRGLLRP